MSSFTFQTITAAQAGAYVGASDSLSFGAGNAGSASVAYLTAPEQVAITFGGLTMNFGTGVYGDMDLTFDNGGMLYVGGTGSDNVTSGAANDALFGGAGADTLNGGAGGDLVQGNQGADSLTGGAGNDSVYGGQDDDVIVLGSGSDEGNWSNGNKGNDTISAGNGGDTILGGQGNDSVSGGAGGDLLIGNLGDDTMNGGGGADTLEGDAGYDVMTGGGGADLFTFAPGQSEVNLPLADRILDWQAGYHIDLPVTGGYKEIASSSPPGNPPPDPYGYDYGYAPTADEFTQAVQAANDAMAADSALRIVSAQAGTDVAVLVDTDGNHQVDMAILLVGRTLDQVDASNFV